MPQYVDFSRWDRSQVSPVPLRSPPQDRNEILGPEILARREAFSPHPTCLVPQFGVHRDIWTREDAAMLLSAREWLAANTTGPWEWHERLSEDMRRLAYVSLYVERQRDQDRFESFARGFFVRRKLHRSEERETAKALGVLPMLDAANSFGHWMEENCGCVWGIDSATGIMTVRFTHPEMEAAFLASDLADYFTGLDSGKSKIYVHGSRRGNDQVKAVRWLRLNAAIEVTAAKGLGKAKSFECRTRYEGTAEAVISAWGDQLQAHPDGRTFSAPDTPRRFPAEMPHDYLAYLRGDHETYEAPYLPDALRKVAAGADEASALAMGL